MSLFISIAAVLGLLVGVGFYIRAEQRMNLSEYLYFVRYSIGFGVLLFLLPLLTSFAARLVENLFVTDWRGAALLTLTATIYAWSVVYSAILTWISIPLRTRLAFRTGDDPPDADGDGPADDWQREAKKAVTDLQANDYVILNDKTSVGALALTLPLLGVIIAKAAESSLANFGGVILGVTAAFLLRKSAAWLVTALGSAHRPEEIWRPELIQPDAAGAVVNRLSWSLSLSEIIVALRDYAYKDFRIAPGMKVVHWRAFRYAVLTILIFIALAFVYYPGSELSKQLPPLVMLLSGTTLLVWGFTFLAYVFDRDRVPLPLLLIGSLVVAQLFVSNPHYYRTFDWPDGVEKLSASDAIAAGRWSVQDDKTLVAVAASGGGIKAALWTAFALERLREDCESIEDRIALVSSVSGGSVGVAHYLDRYVLGRVDATGTAAVAAARPSLGALVWGLVYVDFLPLSSLGWIAGDSAAGLRYWDRGRAQEKAWSHTTRNLREDVGGDEVGRMSTLATLISKGAAPVVIFNACLRETSQRFLMSPVRLDAPEYRLNPKTRIRCEFYDLVTDLGRDMNMMTAARLSATFPWATPQSKSDVSLLPADETETDRDVSDACDTDSGRCEAKACLRGDLAGYHVADGGYFDDSGLISVLGVLDRYLSDTATKRESRPKRIAIIELRASEGDLAALGEPDPDGVLDELFEPLTTGYNVLFGAQAARNRRAVDWVSSFWVTDDQTRGEKPLDVKHFVFHVAADELTWQLTDREQAAIRLCWPTHTLEEERENVPNATITPEIDRAREHNQQQLDKLLDFLRHDDEVVDASQSQ